MLFPVGEGGQTEWCNCCSFLFALAGDTAGNHKTLDQHGALFTDYQDTEPSVLRMLFPLDTFLLLFNNATAIDVQYQAKKSEIVMRHYLPESEKLFVEDVFAKKNMP